MTQCSSTSAVRWSDARVPLSEDSPTKKSILDKFVADDKVETIECDITRSSTNVVASSFHFERHYWMEEKCQRKMKEDSKREDSERRSWKTQMAQKIRAFSMLPLRWIFATFGILDSRGLIIHTARKLNEADEKCEWRIRLMDWILIWCLVLLSTLRLVFA